MKTNFTITKKMIITYTLLLLLLIRFILIDNLLSTLAVAVKSLVLAVVFIYLMNPLVNKLSLKFNLKRKLSVGISYLLLFSVIVLLVVVVTPAIVQSTEMFIQTIPSITKSVNKFINDLDLQKYNLPVESLRDFMDSFNEILSRLAKGLLSFLESAIYSAGSFINWIISLGIALLASWYGLTQYEDLGDRVYSFIRVLFPPKISSQIIRVVKLLDSQIRKFIIGKSISCFFVGLIALILMMAFNGFTSYHIPFIFLIALIIGITNIIPYIGPIFGSIPALLFATVGGFFEVLAVLAIILIVQQIESLYLSPKILGSVVGISPFWTIIFLTLGGSIGGLFGLLLSVPVGATVLLLWQEYAEKKKSLHSELFKEKSEGVKNV